MNFNKDFGILIKLNREKKDLSQEKLAKKSNLSRTALTNIEAGKQSCTLDTAFELADNLGIDMNEIKKLYFKHSFKSTVEVRLSSYSHEVQTEVSQHLGLV